MLLGDFTVPFEQIYMDQLQRKYKKESELDAEAALWVTVSKLKLTQNNYTTFKRYRLFTQKDDFSSDYIKPVNTSFCGQVYFLSMQRVELVLLLTFRSKPLSSSSR